MNITDLFQKGNRHAHAFWRNLRGRPPRPAVDSSVVNLHAALVARARNPVFFVTFQVADSPDGRFDLIALHGILLLERLKGSPQAKGLVDCLFDGFAEGLRTQGAGDMAMVRKLKQMADAFYGRLAVYEGAQDVAALAVALIRNLYRGDAARQKEAVALARYALAARQRLKSWQPGQPLDFGPLPR